MSAVRISFGAVVLLGLGGAGCNLVKGPPRDHECRANLRSIIALEQAHFARTQSFSTHPVAIGWAPSQGNRYLYLFDDVGEVTRRDDVPSPPLAEAVGYGPDTRKRGVTAEELRAKLPPEVLDTLGLEGTCPDCALTVACVGNVDDDADVDVWTISTKDRPRAARGTPIHEAKDL